jgi:hypothetical protein
VAIYEAKTKLPSPNSINRYLINSPMLPDMALGSDGSLTITFKRPLRGKSGIQLAAGPEGVILRATSVLLAGCGHYQRQMGCARARSHSLKMAGRDGPIADDLNNAKGPPIVPASWRRKQKGAAGAAPRRYCPNSLIGR